MANINFEEFQGDYQLFINDVEIEIYSEIKQGKKSISSNEIFQIRPFSINFRVPSFYIDDDNIEPNITPDTKGLNTVKEGDLVELKKGLNTVFYGVIKTIQILDSFDKKESKITCEDFFRTLDNNFTTIQTFTSEETYNPNNNITINSLINSLNNIVIPLYGIEIEQLEDNLQVDTQGTDTRTGSKVIIVTPHSLVEDNNPEIRNLGIYYGCYWNEFCRINSVPSGWSLTIPLFPDLYSPNIKYNLISSNINYSYLYLNSIQEKVTINANVTYNFSGPLTIQNIGINYENISIFKILIDICKITQKRLSFNEKIKKIQFKNLENDGDVIQNFQYFGKKISKYIFKPNFSVPNDNELKVNFQEASNEYDNLVLILANYEQIRKKYKENYTKKITTGTIDLTINLFDKIDNYIVNSIDYKDYDKGYLTLELIGN